MPGVIPGFIYIEVISFTVTFEKPCAIYKNPGIFFLRDKNTTAYYIMSF